MKLHNTVATNKSVNSSPFREHQFNVEIIDIANEEEDEEDENDEEIEKDDELYGDNIHMYVISISLGGGDQFRVYNLLLLFTHYYK